MREAFIVICWISFSLIGQCFNIDVRCGTKEVREVIKYSELSTLLATNVRGQATEKTRVFVNDKNNSYYSIMNWRSLFNIDLKLILRNLTGAGTPINMLDALSLDVYTLDYKTNQLQFFGPFNPVLLISDREIIQHEVDKFRLCSFLGAELKTINMNEIQLENGDHFYIFADGCPNQISEPNRKKIMYKQFRDLPLVIQDKNLVDQKIILDKTIENWRGGLEQLDDILVMSVKINE